jgi:3-hydroxyacyl-CoA dehydrogenase
MQIKKAAVIGGGAMGGGIAHVLSSVGIECFIKDVDQKFVDKALATSKAVYDKLVAKGKLDPKKAEAGQKLLMAHPIRQEVLQRGRPGYRGGPRGDEAQAGHIF